MVSAIIQCFLSNDRGLALVKLDPLNIPLRVHAERHAMRHNASILYVNTEKHAVRPRTKSQCDTA